MTQIIIEQAHIRRQRQKKAPSACVDDPFGIMVPNQVQQQDVPDHGSHVMRVCVI